MTPDQLITFAAIAEHRNISHAALAVHLSQPAVSGQLRQLQEEFGEPLYQREGRGIRLTPAGEQLAQYARGLREIFTHARDYRDALRSVNAGKLRIGASTTPASYLLPYLIAAFQQEAPRVSIQTMSVNTAEVIAALPSLDIAMIEGAPGNTLPPDTAVHTWLEDEIVAIVPAGHPLITHTGDANACEGVTLSALAEQPLVLREAGSGVRQLIELAFAQAGLSMRVALEVAGVEAVKEAVRAGMGVGFVSAMSLRHDDAALVMQALAPMPLTRNFSILVPHSNALSRAAARFLQISFAKTVP